MPWELDGNNPGANQFLGTRQDDPLRIKTRNNVNNREAMIILPAPDANNTGNVGIGTPRPETLTGGRVLHIDNPNGPSALRLGAGATGQQWEWQSTVIGGVGAAMNLSKVTPPAFNPLTVLANGNVGIGTTTPNAKLEINNGDLLFRPPGPPQPGPAGEDPGDIRFESAGGGQKGRIWSNPTAGAGLFLSSADNTPRITIRADGELQIGGRIGMFAFPPEPRTPGWFGGIHTWDVEAEGTIWSMSGYAEGSDARMKANVAKLGRVLDKLDAIRGVSFERIKLGPPAARAKQRRDIGVIAQEVETVFPELVSEHGDENNKAVNYSGLTGVLIEAAKELKAENEALRSRIEVLEGA